MSERKATDILEELVVKIDELTRKVSSQDLVLKALLIKLNNLVEKPKEVEKKINKEPRMVADAGAIMKVPIQQPSLSISSEPPSLKVEEVELKKEEFKEVVEDDVVYTISQRVIDATGKSIYMAAVEVFDLSLKEKITRVTTQSNGKFKVKLKPGSYRFKIYRQLNLNTQRIESMEDVTVVGDSNLPDFVLK